MQILFLDLDGTIRTTKSGQTFINDPYDQKPIEGAKTACDRYYQKGWTLIGITNQGGVAAGYKSLDNCLLEQRETLKLFPQLSSILFCPDNEGRECYRIYQNDNKWYNISTKYPFLIGTYRKPSPGMIQIVCISNEIQFPENCLFVGDLESDELCAINAQIPFIWATDWRMQNDL